jgi:hypothetical protein
MAVLPLSKTNQRQNKEPDCYGITKLCHNNLAQSPKYLVAKNKTCSARAACATGSPSSLDCGLNPTSCLFCI